MVALSDGYIFTAKTALINQLAIILFMRHILILFIYLLGMGRVDAKSTLPFSTLTLAAKNYQKEVILSSAESTNILITKGKQHIIRQQTKPTSQGNRYTLHIEVGETIEWESATLHIPYKFQSNDRIFANGFQSWTGNREMNIGEKTEKAAAIVPNVLRTSGDYLFTNNRSKKSEIFGWLYGYIRAIDNSLTLFASENEDNGYTQIIFDVAHNEILLKKDLLGKIQNEKEGMKDLFDIFIGKGEEDKVFGDYFAEMNLPPTAKMPKTGWTSWYQYYTGISEQICLDNLTTFQHDKIPLDYFQVDDGWQKSVGDWLTINEKFPNGIIGLANNIHAVGYQSGLWLAPFICEQKSFIYTEHKDWILHDKKGKLVKAGYNPGWSGNFYALDFYNPEVQRYLTKVFSTVLQDWKVDFVKLDFLYAVAQIPQHGKSRGEVMTEAMRFLRKICGDKQILGCGVPLNATLGTVDFCRIGPDVGLNWAMKWAKIAGIRELISTKWATFNTIYRHNLHTKLFLNDPDVFNLRGNDNKLTTNQKQSVYLLNQVLGGILFTSDHIGHYNEAQKRMYISQFPVLEKENIHILELFSSKTKGLKMRQKWEQQANANFLQNPHKDEKCYSISFSIGEKKYLLISNLTNKNQKIAFPEKNYTWINPENEEFVTYNEGEGVTLAAYESRIFVAHPEQGFCVVTDDLHLFPSSEIEQVALDGNTIQINFHPQYKAKNGYIWLQVPSEKSYIFEGKSYFPKEKEGKLYLKIKLI